LLRAVIEILAKGEPLPEKHKDHPLVSNWSGYRECHIQSDWLLIYKYKDDELILSLTATGTHSDLFQNDLGQPKAVRFPSGLLRSPSLLILQATNTKPEELVVAVQECIVIVAVQGHADCAVVIFLSRTPEVRFGTLEVVISTDEPVAS
jgi:addiction module toxin, RelE/StbE family